MPRKPRLEVVGLPHHLVQRGVNRQTVFFDHNSYLTYLNLLKKYAEQYEVHIHCWCLMTNHVHLLVTPLQAGSMSRMMQNLNRAYVQIINMRFNRTGHLWSGRFKASLIEHEQYLFTCMRYIELNPVRAGIVKHPNDYLWSSWHANTGRRRSRLITAHICYAELGKSESERFRYYQDLVLNNTEPEEEERLRQATRQNASFGNERFTQHVTDLIGRDITAKPKGRPKKHRRS